MPIYEYVCMSCESHFEELVRVDETPPCPDCGSDECEAAVLDVRSSRPQQASVPRRRQLGWRLLWRKLWLRPLRA